MYLDQVKQQIKALKLALPDELLGCAENEIIGLVPQGGSQKSKVKSQKYYGARFVPV